MSLALLTKTLTHVGRGVEIALLGDSGVSSYTPCYDKAIAKELGTLASGCRNMDRYRRRLIQKEGRGREGEKKGEGK